MAVKTLFWTLLGALSAAKVASGQQLYWNATKFLFTLGDSYTTDGFNITLGVNSTDPGYTSSNGPNWVEYLGETYNVTETKVFNLASGGATIDAALVAPYEPTVLSIVDQVSQFQEYLAPKPYGAQWDSADSLFAIWIGINDVGNSYAWTNVTSQSAFHTILMNRLFSQVEILYNDGARNFLFLTVPPTNRAPLLIEAGPTAVNLITAALADYNDQLVEYVDLFQATHAGTYATVFDTRPVFNTLLDNYATFGYVNITGYCAAYENGTPDMTTQDPPCDPVSNYFWLNTLHPLYTVHNILAHAISTTLSL
ncbi:carbohydrate esterase family 16 protein [Wolfiporia cocos MD-104 SS10]|uniref:Carbohydrate esterase family 16 protein n=1 Tax=Wolfiporia cocos (strain MD-104) TaxID=742152 RepID=A0A2H3J7L2_WOLCO|nr:carbohydrate esterase family 16 protein [Wolfiporia cocos MD-104 SS10]